MRFECHHTFLQDRYFEWLEEEGEEARRREAAAKLERTRQGVRDGHINGATRLPEGGRHPES